MKIVVAPLAGARIEIPEGNSPYTVVFVAPLAGARIEIPFPGVGGRWLGLSLPSRERGLKLLYLVERL